MIEIDRMALRLPAGFETRAEGVVRAAARALAARAARAADGPLPDLRLRALPPLQVRAEAGWTDAQLGGAIAEAVWTATREGGGATKSGGREGGPW
jgi:hypothetical protein